MEVRKLDYKWELVYYIWDERLVGSLGNQSFNIHAVSGGGRGATIGVPDRSLASYSPHRRKAHGIRGGVIPPGWWRVERPSEYRGKMMRPSARLIPMSMQWVDYNRDYDREPFLIHGRGPQGSDGCLVIESDAVCWMRSKIGEGHGSMLPILIKTILIGLSRL
jgi:hypothetical protein